ncbi:IS1380-Spn1 transposase [Streptococcus pneumoniae]|nr:IS1380-Spn1 transposase [Streptococcus pneumoniae]VLR34989.1 IS1380-Spn1 transposase [Streptococcus pneumoniae]VMZ72443.1 IS1380-Spn1 transposase [Streptococcus pneumoniae]
MAILVTGGAGYIGSHTVVELLNLGKEVIIVDNLSNSSILVLDRIEAITGIRPVFYELDVCDKPALRKVFEQESIDAAIHFAGYKAVGESVQKPVMYYKNNIMSTLALVEVMSEFNVKKIVFSSSATVYGINNQSPLIETMQTSATNPYGYTKVMLEQILKDVHVADSEWSIALLRYFNPIGAHESGLIGEDPSGIPNNLMPYIAQVAVGKLSELSVFGNDYDTLDGTGVRDYIHVPQLFTPNLKTIQNPCLSLDPGWFLFSPNGCFLLDKKEFPLYGISVEKNTKRKETHMNSLPNHHFQNKSFYQLSFDGGHLTQYGGLIFFQELFSQLKLKERISKYLVTNDQRRYCRYSDSDILVQFLFQLLTGYGTDYACKELSADAYFPKLLEGGQLASQPTLSRFLSRTDEETVHSLRCLNLELVEFFLQFHQLNQLIVDIDSTHFTTYGKQEGVAYNAHYRAHGYHPLYAFEGKTGYCFNAQLRPGNRYCSEEADSFITPVLERFNQLLFRMDSGFATPKLYNLIEKTGQCYLIKLKKNTVLSRLGDLSLPCPQDEDLTILPHSAYSETLYQAGSWSHKRRVCQFSERKEGNLFYDVISLVTNMTSGTSQDQFQLYRGRGQAENFIKEMKEGFFGDKTDSSTLIKNEVRMMMSCIAYNLYLFLKHLAGDDFQTLTIKRFRHLFLHVVGKCVRTGRKQLLKLSSLYAYSELFSALYSRIRKVNLNLPVPYEPPRRKASLMMH